MSRITQEYADSIEDLARRLHDVAQGMRSSTNLTTWAKRQLASCRVSLNRVITDMMVDHYNQEAPRAEKD